MAAFEFLFFLLVLILVLELAARRLRLPPAAALIAGGAALACVPGVPELRMDPDLVLLVFLPPLLTSSAYFTAWRDFRRYLSSILLLAVGAVVFTTLVVGLVMHWLVPTLPLSLCFALGAIVSPPDAVAAEAILERISLPVRISTLLQGESLLNDAAGLVLFRFALAAFLTGGFSLVDAVGTFAMVSAGGVLIGAVVGWVGLFVIRRLRDSDLAITATLLLAGASYIVADRLGVSGVLSTVTAGLLLGWHQHGMFTAGTRVRAQSFWRVMVFLMQSMLFILIGLSLRDVLARLAVSHHDAWRTLGVPVVATIVVVVLTRMLWMLASDGIRRIARTLGYRNDPAPSVRAAVVMGWAGMRGMVTLAGALSLPANLPGRDLILICAFTIVVVTVLIQGSTLAPLIRLLRLDGSADEQSRKEGEGVAWVRLGNAQLAAAETLSRGPDGSEQHPRLLEQYRYRAFAAVAYARDPTRHRPLEVAHFRATERIIEAGRAELLQMHQGGLVHDQTLRALEEELDLQQMVADVRLSSRT